MTIASGNGQPCRVGELHARDTSRVKMRIRVRPPVRRGLGHREAGVYAAIEELTWQRMTRVHTARDATCGEVRTRQWHDVTTQRAERLEARSLEHGFRIGDCRAAQRVYITARLHVLHHLAEQLYGCPEITVCL